MRETYKVLGIGAEGVLALNQRANEDNIDSIARSARLLRMYDADLAQNLFNGTGDFNPLPGSDPEVPWTGGNLAIGIIADQTGIQSPEDASEFFMAYAAKLHKASTADPRQFVKDVQEHEAHVLKLLSAANQGANSEAFKLARAQNPWLRPGMDRNTIRREHVEYIIAQGGS